MEISGSECLAGLSEAAPAAAATASAAAAATATAAAAAEESKPTTVTHSTEASGLAAAWLYTCTLTCRQL